jgi:UDP-sulfoquinovose synthase
MSSKKIIIVGGDGFCGWPTSLYLSRNNYEVLIVDNLSRREIDKQLKSNSLTNIASINDRVSCANKNNLNINFEEIDVANEYDRFLGIVKKFKPNAIVQFGEQRAAPYSMIGDKERRYTVDNNITATHNICSAIVEVDKDIHLIHLGTMGVYGYSKEMGPTPEGYLEVTINQTKMKKEILFPVNPGSVYHMTKCLDQLMFQFYQKNWGLRITDLHQGIVWGAQTKETKIDEKLVNRFDYDGIYGTVLNRFIVQAVNNHPLSIYGSGGQSRAFIHISDTARCIELAIKNFDFDNKRVRIFNQVSEVYKVKELAKMISHKFNVEVDYLNNPRKELADNELEVSNEGFMNLGFKPILLNDGLVEDVKFIAEETKQGFNIDNVNNSPNW